MAHLIHKQLLHTIIPTVELALKMNLGPNANDALKQQRPTYLVASNFTTRPFPDGPLDLGTLVEDIKDTALSTKASTIEFRFQLASDTLISKKTSRQH